MAKNKAPETSEVVEVVTVPAPVDNSSKLSDHVDPYHKHLMGRRAEQLGSDAIRHEVEALSPEEVTDTQVVGEQ